MTIFINRYSRSFFSKSELYDHEDKFLSKFEDMLGKLLNFDKFIEKNKSSLARIGINTNKEINDSHHKIVKLFNISKAIKDRREKQR